MKFARFFLLGITLFLTAGVYAQTSPAGSDDVSTSSPSSQAALSDDAALSAVQPAFTTSERTGPVAAHRDGLWLSTEDGHTKLHVHGYVQADDRMFSATTHDEELDTFLFRRIRPLFEGTLLNNVDFRFMPDFGQNDPQIQEAFLELKTVPFAKLRAGKFKEPIGLEVLRSDRELIFAERSLASDLVPLRYIGAQFAGSVISDSIEYAAGYFDGSSDGSNGAFTKWIESHEAVARAFFLPFAATPVTPLKQLGFGVAGSAGTQEGSIAGLKTTSQTTFFKYSSTTYADGQHNRLSPQAYYYVGPFGALAEYVISSQEVLNGARTGRVKNDAWEVTGTVMLTGEKNSYAGVRPRNASEPVSGWRRFGGLELAVRYSQLAIDHDAFPHFASVSSAAQQAKEEGIVLNWYMTRYVKLVTNYEHTGFRMAAGNTTPLHNVDVLMTRVQLAF
jgi:phosphate-selective porin OprO and OprP